MAEFSLTSLLVIITKSASVKNEIIARIFIFNTLKIPHSLRPTLHFISYELRHK